MEGTKVLTDKTRTKSQDWSRMDHFLTESIWQALEQKPFRDAMDRIICHLWRLGLRNPSEGSKAWITALLLLYQPSKTPFELRTTFTTAILNKTAAGVKVYNSTAKPGDVLIFPDAAGILQWILTDGSHGVFLLQRLELVPSTVFNIPFPALSRSFFLFPPSRIFFINCTDSLTWRASMRIQGRTQTWAQRLVYHQQSLEPVRFFGKSLHHACMVATRWWALDLLTLSASEKNNAGTHPSLRRCDCCGILLCTTCIFWIAAAVWLLWFILIWHIVFYSKNNACIFSRFHRVSFSQCF